MEKIYELYGTSNLLLFKEENVLTIGQEVIVLLSWGYVKR
jgi:hypothetical protein